MRTLEILTVLTAFVAPLFAADPSSAIGAARQAINQKQFASAVKVLHDALPDASRIANPKERDMALAALHFYSALAFTGLNDEADAKNELSEFFRLSPQTAGIDPNKYDPQFVRYFNEVRAAASDNGGGFAKAYPGFASFSGRRRAIPVAQWGNSTDLELLGTADEKHEWGRLTTDEDRQAFVDRFWERHGANGFRAEFNRRVAFADETFGTEKTHGSLTDRGRVFVLLGPPKLVKQKPLSALEGASVRNAPATTGAQPPSGLAGESVRTSPATTGASSWQTMQANDINRGIRSPDPVTKGLVERWLFSRDQIPPTIPDTEVVIKFITEEGYGDHVLQRDFMVIKVLHDAAAMH